MADAALQSQGQMNELILEEMRSIRALIAEKDDRAALAQLSMDMGGMKKQLTKIETDVKPVVEWFSHMTWAKSSLLYVAGAVGTIGGAFAVVNGWISLK